MIQAVASAADPLMSPDHAIIAGIASVLAVVAQFVQAKIRTMRRSRSLRDEVRALLLEESDDIVRTEVARQIGLRALQDGQWRTELNGSMANMTDKLEEIEAAQEQTSKAVDDVNKQLNHMRLGLYKLVAAIKPELVANLDLGTPS